MFAAPAPQNSFIVSVTDPGPAAGDVWPFSTKFFHYSERMNEFARAFNV